MTSFIGTREAFTAAITELTEKDRNVVFVSSDSLKAMRAVPYSEQYPDNYIEVGIAEQCAVDAAAGMASCGITPFVATYGGFITMRGCEQVRTFVAYPNLNVKFFGVNSGLIGGEREGTTHQFYEDLAILSAIPNVKIYIPADAQQAYHAVKMAYDVDGPVYIRAGSGREVNIYDIQTPFSKDGVTVLKKYGLETVVFANGFILDRVLAAADILVEQGVNVTVADVNILYGDHPDKIIDLIKTARNVVTVEDHNINGGLGSYICHLACEHAPKSIKRIGLTEFAESGPANELADAYGFSPERLAESILAEL